MTIQIPNPGTGVPADQTGDSPWLAMKKVSDNFSNQTHAASRLVGIAAGNVMEVGAFGLGGDIKLVSGTSKAILLSKLKNKGSQFIFAETATSTDLPFGAYCFGLQLQNAANDQLIFALDILGKRSGYTVELGNGDTAGATFYTTGNATSDPNGFLKGASPIAEIYSDKMDLNQDATQQGVITFAKLGMGDYLIKGSLGFAQEGWYIETPKDANGNVLVAVVYEQLANNDLSIKTYAKKFDEETGDIVANLTRPRDIPVGRFISLRLHELPKEPPVMPADTQTEV